jgi:PAS domain S-box-containing protein
MTPISVVRDWRDNGLGLRGRLVLTFSGLVGVVALFAALVTPALLNRYIAREAIERTRTVAGIIGYSLAAPLHFGDDEGVAEVLDALRRDDALRFLSVRDSTGRLVARRGQVVEARAGLTPDGNTFVTAVPIRQGSASVGTLTLGASFDALNRTRRQASRLGLLIGLGILLVGLAVVYGLSRLLTRSLTAVVDTVQRISEGDLTLRAERPRERELSELVRAFNGMVDNFVAAQQELSGVNGELETRVASRTAQLQDALSAQSRGQRQLAESVDMARANAAMLQTFIDVAPQAILAVDPDFRVTRWNKAAERLFGWTAEEVIGRRIPYIPEEGEAAFEQVRALLGRGELPPASEVVRRRKDGSLVTVLLAVAAMRDASGRTTGYIGVLTDLTDRKGLEAQLRQSQKMEAIGRLAGGIAHDFNNILTVITACASLLRDTAELPAEMRTDVQQILDAAVRAAALTRQLLTFSRSQVITLRPVHVGSVVDAMHPMLRRLLRENIDLRVRPERGTQRIHADPMQIEQVIMNLVVNAADAMPEGGQIAVETSTTVIEASSALRRHLSPGAYLTLVVRDSGIGMDEATLSRIFEPFFTTKGIGQGTGLGLATTYAIVDQLKGHIDVQSAVGHGTTFTIYIPVMQGAAGESAPHDAAADRRPSRGSETVLLVEDEQSVRAMLRRTLEREGYTVIEAADAEAGLALAASSSGIDMVVTDMMMPGMNGRVFAERLRKSYPTLRVVFMSGYADDTVRGPGLVDATHVFIQKPFTGAQLAATIRAVLDRGQRAAA